MRRRDLVDLWLGRPGSTELKVDVVMPNGDEYRRCSVVSFGIALELTSPVGDLHSVDPEWVVSAHLVERGA
jgi:hypothetical protein